LKKLASSHLHRESSAGSIETTAVSYSARTPQLFVAGTLRLLRLDEY
jgi:hypothetical protein